MNIFYDSSAGYWYQTYIKSPVTFGGLKKLLPFHSTIIDDSLSFRVNFENQHAGPIIGIVTARKADGTIAGNSALFIKLQKKLLLHGGFSYIFTPQDIEEGWVNGYIFMPERNYWQKVKAPFPDLVYNRIPFRKVEQGEECQAFFSLLKMMNIPFFNPCFLNKFEVYSLLQNHPVFKRHLPKTMLISDEKTLYAFLEMHQSVYLKPSHSAKGKGIFRLAYNSSEQLYLEGIKDNKLYSTFSDFWNEWEKDLIDKQYLAQEEVNSAKYDDNRFDLRILAHAQKGGYTVTGVGVRQAAKQTITTHVPHGGKLLPYDLFQSEELNRFISYAVNIVGEALTMNYGFFGEFSIDAGISADGDYFLYEVNSKPMSFDEIDIEEKKIERLCDLFFNLTKFPVVNENQPKSKE